MTTDIKKGTSAGPHCSGGAPCSPCQDLAEPAPQSTSEILVSMHDQLQSVSAQLEASQAALQAVNVGRPAQVDALAQSSGAREGPLSNRDAALVFFDRSLRVKHYSPAMGRLLDLTPADVGRPLERFGWRIDYPELHQDATRVLTTSQPIEREAMDLRKGNSYLVRISACRTLAGQVDGVAVTCVDITTQRRTREELMRERRILAGILEGTDVMLVYLDTDFNFLAVNQAYANTCRKTPAELIGRNHFELYPNAENEAIFRRVRDTGTSVFYKDKSFVFPDQPERGVTYWDWSLAPARGEDGAIAGLVFSLRETTEHHLLEQALEQSEARFRAFMDNSPAIAWMKDEQGRYVYLSKTFEERFGVNFGGWEGKTDFELRPGKVAEEFVQNDHIVLQSGRRLETTEQTLGEDGSPRFWWSSRFPVQDAAGRRYVGGVGVDISERLAAEQALRETLERERARRAEVEAILEATPAAVLISREPDCVVITGNAASYELLRMKPGSNTSKSSSEADVGHFRVFHEGRELRPEQLPIQRAAATGERIRDFEEEILFDDGARVWIYGNAVPLRDANGTPSGAVAAFVDISQRVKAEAALRDSEDLVRTILDSVDEGFIVINPRHEVVMANRPHLRQRGFDASEGARAPSAAARPIEVERHLDPIQLNAVREVFHTGAPRACIHSLQAPDGKARIIETKVYPMRDRSGSVGSAIATTNDITEKRLLEAERLKLQKLESIGTLAGGIAHDFNNLLQGVFGALSLAKETVAQPDQLEALLTDAETALHQAIGLTTQLLTFSKGGLPVKQRMALLPAVESAARFALAGSRTEYRLEVEQAPWSIDGDAGQLMQVFQNLVINAREAMAGSGTVTLGVENVVLEPGAVPELSEGGKFVRVAVRDTGCGIAEEILPSIFDPYFSTKPHGSGLGLATTFSIVRNHGGTIEVRSTLGRGTTFTLYLPALDGAPPDRPSRQPNARALGQCRVLVMDDEEMIRALAGKMLAKLGHEVCTVDDGQSAVAQYAAAQKSGRPYDLVILDLTIKGGLGGVDTLEQLKRCNPNVVAIVSSGFSEGDLLADYRTLGFAGVLRKPYRMEELRHLLGTLQCAPRQS